jgi:hypothetical protein
MEEHLKLIIIQNHKFLFMVSLGTLAAVLILIDGYRALKDSGKEPLILFSFRNGSGGPVKGWTFIILGSIIIITLVLKLILHFR